MAATIQNKQRAARRRITLITILPVVPLLLTYVFTSLAFNSGSLWEYGVAFLCLIWTLRTTGALLLSLIRKGKKYQAARA